jgi:type IV pilus assembly protein PilE
MRPPARQVRQGFTLIELMVVVVIAGILAAIAYPAYTSSVQRSRRADAMSVLTALVQAQERYRSNNSAYAPDVGTLGMTNDVSAIAPNYDVSIAGVGNPPALASGYIATATVKSSGLQKNDTSCATMSIQLQGALLQYLAYDASSNDTRLTCWGR